MTTLTIPESLHETLLDIARDEVETGGVLLAKLVRDQLGNARLIAARFLPVPDEAYLHRDGYGLEVSSDGYMHALKEAELGGYVAIWTHSHPGNRSRPRPSIHDLKVNEDLRDLFAARTGTGLYAWLIISHDGDDLTFCGGTEDEDGAATSIDRLSSIGARFRFYRAHDSVAADPPSLFDRNIRAFGSQIQGMLGDLAVAIVGAGGTGSAVAEQLIRLGVRNITLIDHDSLSASNTTRVYGSSPSDVDRAKVDVLGDHLERIASGVSVTRLEGTILHRNVAQVLVSADIVFGCTDDNAGRVRLSRLPYYYLVPLIDCGVQLDADANNIIQGIFGRVTTVHPGAACLICRNRIDLARASAEVLAEGEQRALEKEGYAPALAGIEPAVVTFTTLVAATAVSEMLERLIGYGETPVPSEQLLYVHDRTVRLNHQVATDGHYCDMGKSRVGTDDDDMLLGLNWAS